MVGWLKALLNADETRLYFAAVVACGLLTFHSMPDTVPFLVRLLTMALVQFTVGMAVRRDETGER